MKILLFGVSNVGKTTTGEILAKKLGYNFYDLDEEVRRKINNTLEFFVNIGTVSWRDDYRGEIILDILKKDEDLVFAISPISFPDSFEKALNEDDILCIELYDTKENLFDRMVFSDENDVIYTDDEYKNEHKDYYLRNFADNLIWYHDVYDNIGITNRLFVNADPQDRVADRIIKKFKLKSKIDDNK